MTIMYVFPSEDGDVGPFISKEILWLNSGKSKFRIKFEYVFSAPECLLVCKGERYEKLKVSYLKGSRVL